MHAAPTARIDDGQLDLVQAGAFDLLGTLGMLPRLLMGWHVGHPKIHLLKTLGVQIESTQPLPLASDGEYRGTTYALRIQLAPKRLQVVTLVP
jgi:diacylglycerol kinase family enzyme